MYNDMAHDLPHTRWKDIADEIAVDRRPRPAAGGRHFVTAQEVVRRAHAATRRRARAPGDG